MQTRRPAKPGPHGRQLNERIPRRLGTEEVATAGPARTTALVRAADSSRMTR